MIIDIQNEESTQPTTASDAKPAKTSKGSPEIRGKKNLKGNSIYLVSPKFDLSKNDGVDLHAGREFAESNIPMDMIHPSTVEKTMVGKREMTKYRKEYATAKADFYYDHAADGRNNSTRSKGKQMDAFRFIISCKPEELSHCQTDKEKGKFLCSLARATLQKMSGSSEINFYYDFVPHLKDGNPHVHIMMSSYTIDGQYYEFYRGKQDHGLIKLFDDVKYELEAKHPTLLQMEHEKREKNRLQIVIDKGTNAVTGEHAEIFNRLNVILNAHAGANYSHPKIQQELADAGFEFRYTKAKSKSKFKDIQIFHKDAGDAFRSYANLPFEAKRVIENFETYQFFAKGLKIRTDVSAVVSKATALVNMYPTKNVPELNTVLYKELGVMLVPSFKKDKDTGRKYVGSWSFYMVKENVKFPVLKAGVTEPKLLTATQEEAVALHEQCEDMTHTATQAQQVKGKDRYTKREWIEPTPFRFHPNESTQDFIARMLASRAYKQSLTSQIAMGNSLISTYNNRKMIESNGVDSLQVFQANRSSAKAAIQWYVAQGFISIEFKGTQNPAIQKLMYIESVLHGIEIDNFKPSAELKAEAQALLDAERDKVNVSNKVKIHDFIKANGLGPVKPSEGMNLRANRKLDVDVDQRPKLHSFLYGIHMGLSQSHFKHIDKLTLTNAEKKKVIEHFAIAERLNAAQMADVLKRAGISLDAEEPPEATQKSQQIDPRLAGPQPVVVNPNYVPVPDKDSPRTEQTKAEPTQPVSQPILGLDQNDKTKP